MNQDNNPYHTPQSKIEQPPVQALPVEPAGKWLRLANFFLDYVAFTIFGMIVGAILSIVFGREAAVYINSLPDYLIGLPVVIIYYLAFEGITNRTMGKYITGTIVVNAQGLPPSFGQIMGRTFSRFIPFEVFSFLGPQGRGWHDSLPGTYVVRYRR